MDNKRNFYRVQIRIGMRIVQLSNEPTFAPAESYFSETQAAQLKRGMHTLRKSVNEHLRDIPPEYDPITLALHGLQQQIDMLLVAHCKNTENYHHLKVSLSEGGMGWKQREPLSIGLYLALKLELDELVSHCVIGKVVSCNGEKDHYNIGVEFTDIDEDVLQSIAKFVLQTDAEQRRIRKTLT